MKSYQLFVVALWIVLSAFSCQNEPVVPEKPYLPEYTQYEKQVQMRVKRVAKPVADSTAIYMENFTKKTAIYSCTWCLVDYRGDGVGTAGFEPLRSYSRKHPETLAILLDKGLRGTGMWRGFYKLFTELYPVRFAAMLKAKGIVLIPDDRITPENKDKNFQNKYETLKLNEVVEAYLELTK